MLKCKENDDKRTLILDSEDYGIGVEVTINNFEFSENDNLIFTIRKRNLDREIVLQKECAKISGNSVMLLISEEETKLLSEGIYSYELEIYRDNIFLLTITQNQDFIVEGGY